MEPQKLRERLLEEMKSQNGAAYTMDSLIRFAELAGERGDITLSVMRLVREMESEKLIKRTETINYIRDQNDFDHIFAYTLSK